MKDLISIESDDIYSKIIKFKDKQKIKTQNIFINTDNDNNKEDTSKRN